MTDKLTILKASAGSGKTYQLALNYLLHLFSDDLAYRRILAVTFTNKASNEMKERIIHSLYLLSKNDPAVREYRKVLLNSGHVSTVEELTSRAEFLLKKILNDYSSFFVGTIDRFFQWVIRGFTREIGLQTGYNLELNTDRILTEAIDRILLSLKEDRELRKWILDYAEEKLNEGLNWKIESYLYGLGREIFQEKYQELFGSVSRDSDNRKRIHDLRNTIQRIRQTTESEMKNRSEQILSIAEEKGLTLEDFSRGKSGVMGYIRKVSLGRGKDFEPGSTAKSAVDNPEVWVKKTHPSREMILSLAETRLMPLLESMTDYWNAAKEAYSTAVELHKNIYTFGLLSDISEAVREICQENNSFLLSDSALFLHRIIDGNDTPFIFEKAGNYFNIFMLDEFQDTSRFQWENFHPLIMNGLSEHNPSLLVGDVKQSIYRWRNSDWKILASDVYKKIGSKRILEKKLKTNYRSSRNLVSFFNSLFLQLPEMIQENMRTVAQDRVDPLYLEEWIELAGRVYENSAQDFPAGKDNYPGYVESLFSEKKNMESYREYLETRIPVLVKELQDRNIKARDITFLVRKKAEGKLIADILMNEQSSLDENYNFNVISNDALYVKNNSAVSFLLGMLKLLSGQEEKINESFLRHEIYTFLISGDEELNPDLLFRPEGRSEKTEPLKAFMEAGGTSFGDLQQLPLFELLEELISIFRLSERSNDIAYIQAFQDFVLTFLREETGDISSFLRHWDRFGKELMLNASEEQEAMRIMTVHKAKGLQFKVVIIPFCDWSMNPGSSPKKKTTLWVDTSGTPFSDIPVLPLQYSSLLPNTFFNRPYWEETFLSWIDNLNLLYVAMTRAEEELYTFSGLSSTTKDFTIGTLLHKVLDHLPEIGSDAEKTCFHFGEKQIKGLDLPQDTQQTIFFDRYRVHNSTPSLLKNNRNIYLSGQDEEFSDPAGFGTQMHEIFSGITTCDDVDQSIRRVWLKGVLTNEERDELSEQIHSMIEEKPYKPWFDGEGKVYTEHEIMDETGNILRPDRVIIKKSAVIVVDFKFGKEEHSGYLRQVKDYMTVLASAGYTNIRGYVWYPLLKVHREVE